MIATTSRLVELIRDSELLDANQLATLSEKLQHKYREPPVLANELVRRGWLTDYQLRKIITGDGLDLVLGPYLILEPIATGGMGQIYKARHRQTGNLVALKVIRRDRRSDVKALSRFRREVQALANLRHPNIVTACDLEEIGVAHYYAMEYVDGIDLEEVITQTGRLPVAAACDYVRQAALGLQHAHENGLIHRDIKPGNLLIGRGRADNGHIPPGLPPAARERFGRWGIVKLLDLGLVLLRDRECTEGPQGPITQQGFALGTVDYMAPEQIVNPHNVDIRADLYSLGCAFYEMLTGRVPFPDKSSVQKLIAHRTLDPVPVQQERPEVPAEVATVLNTLLAKHPTRRYQTPGETAEALGEVLAGMNPAAVDLDWKLPALRKETAGSPSEEQAAVADDDAPEQETSSVLYIVIAAVVFLLTFFILFRVL